MAIFFDFLTPSQQAQFKQLSSPAKIQSFLDETPYSPEDRDRCPVNVIRDRVAHCLDGALFGAFALSQIGFPPLVVDMFPDPGMDDDHVLAVYQVDGFLGAVAKSNYVGLRFREPVYRNLRELVISYFDVYYNTNGIKTLRTYTRLFNLNTMDPTGWVWDDAGAKQIELKLQKIRRFSLLTPKMIAGLTPVDSLSFQAGMLGSNPDGLYKPRP